MELRLKVRAKITSRLAHKA